MTIDLDRIDRNIINELQKGLPVVEAPFAVTAQAMDLSENELLLRIQRLLDNQILSRFGPMFNAEKLGGGLTLAAMAVAEKEIDSVAALINNIPQVAHNYLREHDLNIWFVIATESRVEIEQVISQIEKLTGYRVYNMPKEEEYYVGLHFSV